MKEHVQDYGVRKWAGDDLIELQAEPLSALQALVAPYAPCILTGCELETIPDGNGDYLLHAGYVALKGRKTVENGAGAGTEGAENGAGGTEDGEGIAAATAENEDTTAAEEYVKIVRVSAQTVKQPTVFLVLACTPVSRAYGNGENKAIAYDYTAEVCDVLSEVGDRPYLTLVADNSKNPRLPDTLGITRKLDSVGGEAKDTVVTFTETVAETDSIPDRPELKSGSRLGLLMRQIRKWFDELKGLKDLAFKDKVALTDLDADVKEALDGKVAQEDGMGLSQANFTTVEKLKLEGIKDHANNYTHPTYTSRTGNQEPMAPKFGGVAYTYMYNVDTQGHVTGVNSRTITIPSTLASTSTAGLMSAADKIKLNGIATGATKVIVDSALSSSSTNPVQNKVVYSALAGKADNTHDHSWGSITGKPSTFTPASHSHDPIDIGSPRILAAGSFSSAGVVTMHYNLGMFTISRTANGRYKMEGSGIIPAGAIVLANITGSDVYLSLDIKTVRYNNIFYVYVTSGSSGVNTGINFMIISPI